jgi:pyruvate dehydrogenase E1 component
VTTSKAERSIISDGLPNQTPDADPDETAEWLESLDAVVGQAGRGRARFLMLKLLERAREKSVGVPGLRSTDYLNTIPPEREPAFPGDEDAERRIRAFVRWNAAVMVSRANRPEIGVGGHIATYASAASLYEVGFNHFFRGKDVPDGSGDQIFFQGHASPGVYARAYLEGRLTTEHLDGFRQESRDASLPSYPHPRLMPDFWEFPTVSMGLGPIAAIYQARFNRYLHHRGIKDTAASRSGASSATGDGRAGVARGDRHRGPRGARQPGLRRQLQPAALDGPVRGNGKIIQELEASFRGAGWNVVKVVWGRQWDDLLARDVDGVLLNAMNTTPTGSSRPTRSRAAPTPASTSSAGTPAAAHGRAPVRRPDPRAAPRRARLPQGLLGVQGATETVGQPTVILAHTVKGWTLGEGFEGRNATHQMKKLTKPDLKALRDRLYLPISDKDLEGDLPPYYHPGADSDEVLYMKERRAALGGSIPRRVVRPSRSSCRRARSTTSSSAAPASRRSPPRWPSCGCSRTS